MFYLFYLWLDGRMVSRSQIKISATSLLSATLGKLFPQMCLCHQAVLTWYQHKLGR